LGLKPVEQVAPNGADWESQRDSVTEPGVVLRMQGYPGNITVKRYLS
jgi:hypothetical protein